MHKILVHAQHSCACTTLLRMHWRGQGPRPGPKQKAPPRAGPAAAFFWVPALVPGPSSAYTRVLCMHKSVVHAQESCACTRILCTHNIPFYSHIIRKYCSETFPYQRFDCLVHLHLHSRLRRIQWHIVKCWENINILSILCLRMTQINMTCSGILRILLKTENVT